MKKQSKNTFKNQKPLYSLKNFKWNFKWKIFKWKKQSKNTFKNQKNQ